MNIRSSLFLPLEEEQLRAIVRELLHTEPIEYRLLSGGLFNTTYFVKTADCGDVILRAGPVNRHLKQSTSSGPTL